MFKKTGDAERLASLLTARSQAGNLGENSRTKDLKNTVYGVDVSAAIADRTRDERGSYMLKLFANKPSRRR